MNTGKCSKPTNRDYPHSTRCPVPPVTPPSPVVEEIKSEAPAPVPPQPQYLTKEEAANLIGRSGQQAKDTGRREMQSEKDREVASAIRRQRQLEAELETMTASFKNLDPDLRKTWNYRSTRLVK